MRNRSLANRLLLSKSFDDAHSVRNELVMKDNDMSEEQSMSKVISELVPRRERLDLVQKFIIMAMRLSPNTAWEDLNDFKESKEARDKFAHGIIKNPGELPIQKVTSLLKRYFDIVIKSNSK